MISDEEATAEHITATVAAMTAEAQAEEDLAAEHQAAAEEILADARERIAEIARQAEAEAGPLTAAATAARRKSGELAATTEKLRRAAAAAVKAETSDAAVSALEEERAGLAGKAADLSGRLGELAEERTRVTADLDEAREAADLDTMTTLRNRLGAVEDLAETLAGQRDALQPRLEAIGDGSFSPVWPQKLLYEARRVAGADRGMVREILNDAFPDRPEAAAAAERRNRQLYAGMDAQEFAAEQARLAQQDRQFVVRR